MKNIFSMFGDAKPSKAQIIQQLGIVEVFPQPSKSLTGGVVVKECKVDVNVGDWAVCVWKVTNSTGCDWDDNSVLKNDFCPGASAEGELAPLVFRPTKGRRSVFLTVKIFIPLMCGEQTLRINFYFESPKK